MSSQDIDEMLTYVSQIMYQIEQGDFSKTEVELVVSLFSGLTKPETRVEILRSFTRTISTIPPPPPITEPPDGPFVESEKNVIVNKAAEETIAFSTGPDASVEPPPASFAPKIRVKPSVDTTYRFSGRRTSRQLREGPHTTRLDGETTKDRLIIDVRSLRDPEAKSK